MRVSILHRHRGLDGGMRVVACDLKILKPEIKDRGDGAGDPQGRQRAEVAGKLGLHLFHMVGIDMRVADGMDEIPGLIARDMGEHDEEEGVRGDVERHAKEHVGAALVKLQVQLAAQDADLPHRMAGRQRHLRHVGRVPSRDDQAAGVGGFADHVDQRLDLVHAPEIAPLAAIDGAKVAVRIGPFIPDADAVFLEVTDVGIALQEPQKFVDDGFEMQLLGGDQREAIGQRVAALQAEMADGAGARAVGRGGALGKDGAERDVILLHGPADGYGMSRLPLYLAVASGATGCVRWRQEIERRDAMGIRYLHTMVRVKDLEASIAFYKLLGLEETRRYDNEGGRFTLVFLAPPGQPDCPVELTYNWDGDDGLPSDSRHFGHLAYEVEDIHATCAHLQANGVVINRPPRDGRMAFVRSPDNISIELLQKGGALEPVEPWKSMASVGHW